MHVLFAIYNAADKESSICNAAKMQAEFLVKCGDRVTLVSNKCPSDWDGVSCENINALPSKTWELLNYIATGTSNILLKGNIIKRFDMTGVLPQALFGQSAMRRALQIHRRHPIDCCICVQHVVAFGFKRLYVSLHVPFILVSQGDIFQHPPESFSIPTTLLYRKSARYSYKAANHVIAVSRYIQKQAIACGAQSKNITVIPNGISLDEITAGTSDVMPHVAETELLFVGRLAAEKGVAVLLKSLIELKDISVHLRIIGAGPLESSLKALTQQLQLQDKCNFLGKLNRKELAKYYAGADIVLLPSITDALPIVALEAQACGLPVIASNTGGLSDIIEDGKNGYLVPVDDVNALAAAIRRLCQDKALRIKMSTEARLTAARFAWPNLLNRFRETIVTVITTKGSGGNS